jgi:uncharacterized coiled-coil DUF342 family protein
MSEQDNTPQVNVNELIEERDALRKENETATELVGKLSREALMKEECIQELEDEVWQLRKLLKEQFGWGRSHVLGYIHESDGDKGPIPKGE